MRCPKCRKAEVQATQIMAKAKSTGAKTERHRRARQRGASPASDSPREHALRAASRRPSFTDGVTEQHQVVVVVLSGRNSAGGLPLNKVSSMSFGVI